MKTRNLIALAAFGGLLVAAGCTKKDEAAVDTTGTAAMTDTGMGAGAATGATGTTGTMTDSTGATTGTMMDTTAGRASGDTTTKR